MSRKFSIKSLTGLTVAAATLLAFAPFAGTANAADSEVNLTNATAPDIKITAAAGDLEGHKFAAVRIGTYTKANYDTDHTDTLTSVLVGTSTATGMNAAAAKALKDTKTAASISPTTPDDSYTDNPVGEVASKWLGLAGSDDSTSNTPTAVGSGLHGWDGNLRTFATNLSSSATFKGLMTTAAGSHSSAAGTDTDTSVTVPASEGPGIYIVEDVTNPLSGSKGHKASIPMLVSTGVKSGSNTFTKLGAGENSQTLGEVSMKADKPWVKKATDTSKDNDSSIGGTLHYKLTSQVPLTTGFPHYVFAMVDNPAAVGLTYNDAANATVVKIGTQTMAKDTDYTVTEGKFAAPNASSTKYVVFDLTPCIMKVKYQDPITITYSMKVNDDANGGLLKNGVTLGYSNDTKDPGSDDKAQPDPDDNGKIKDCKDTATPETCTNGSISNDTGSGDDTNASNYFRHFTLKDEVKTTGAGISGAKFQVLDGTTPVKFKKVGDGSYKKIADQTKEVSGDDVVTDLAVKSTAAAALTDGDPTALGDLRVDGLKDGGTYTVKKVANNSDYIFKPSTDVTVGGLASDASKYGFANTKDNVYGLVDVKGNPSTNPKTLTAVDMSTDAGSVVFKNVKSVSQLPLTGGAGMVMALLVIVALALVVGGLITLRRKLRA
ncbi:isopeptide-forming domain-containing fimbrial protein [Bifidobacterium sp. ESL0763]|uniref:isopeptide-forming domain-containing fimbrial protein n=1 Tax=Bifidobacterium sp. ESL0763 TaxID=2983227 RepID=UPI0023F8B9B1|nr:isopeptide-forming domain-containing fimbrial protein [Bifidobacterium sp. ESL0763]MDF7663208.1 isopeptide-forming domain-containing fimbrial protein [Bifidobacterium sp. ESL0763]